MNQIWGASLRLMSINQNPTLDRDSIANPYKMVLVETANLLAEEVKQLNKAAVACGRRFSCQLVRDVSGIAQEHEIRLPRPS